MTDKNSPIVTDINRPVLVPPGGNKKSPAAFLLRPV